MNFPVYVHKGDIRQPMCKMFPLGTKQLRQYNTKVKQDIHERKIYIKKTK